MILRVEAGAKARPALPARNVLPSKSQNRGRRLRVAASGASQPQNDLKTPALGALVAATAVALLVGCLSRIQCCAPLGRGWQA